MPVTGVAGDPAGCAAAGRTLLRAAAAVDDPAGPAGPTAWTGTAADGHAAAAAARQAQVRAAADRVAATGQALVRFAAELAEAQAVAGTCVLVPGDPAEAARQRAAVAARAEALADAAHRRLVAACAASSGPGPGPAPGPSQPPGPGGLPLPGPVDLLDATNALLLAPVELAERYGQRAVDAGRQARALKDLTRVGSAAERAAARADWRQALRGYRELRRVEQAYASLAEAAPAPGWLVALNRPLSDTVPVLRQIPVASVVLVGAATWADHRQGMGWELAATKNVAATAAGMAAYSGTTALLGGALVGGPLVFAAVGAGVLVSWGVGYAVQHWGDDAAAALGDAAGAVGGAARDAAGAVGDAAAGAWHAVFG